MAIQKIPNTLIADNAVTAAKIANGTLTADDIAANSITGAKISATTSLNLAGLNTSGNVAIGGTSPTNALDVNGNQVLLANGALKFADAGNAHIGMIKNSGSSGTGQLEFYTGSAPSERMRIDSSGNVGIGISNIGSYGLSLSNSMNFNMSEGANSSFLNIFRQASSAATVIANGYKYTDTANKVASSYGSSWAKSAIALNYGNTIFFNDTAATTAVGTDVTPTESMRIDSSGNLLVNKTASGSLGTAGFEFASNNTLRATKGSSAPAEFNRLNDDGNIALFYKDTSPVGSIGAYGGASYIGGNLNGSIYFNGNTDVRPFNKTSLANYDNQLNLGGTTSRWKDLYLSGGAFIGGTGSANKLDDYEEGTYTATISCASGSITLNTSWNALRYTKVGRQVHVQGTLAVSSVSSPSGATYLNLPFTSGSDTKRSGNADNVISGYFNGSAITNGIYTIYGNIPESSSTNRLFVMPGHQNSYATYNLGDNYSAGGTDYYVNFTYTI